MQVSLHFWSFSNPWSAFDIARLHLIFLSIHVVHPPYTHRVKQEVEFESEFERGLTLTAEQDAAKAEASAAAEAAKAASDERERELDALRLARRHGERLMHAWVLVKAGARGVAEDTFVEVTSGRRYRPLRSPYTGIEWVWNHENLWIAMDLPEPHSDARLHPARAVFDFWDAQRWEAVLPRPRPPPPVEDDVEEAEEGEGAAEGEPEEPPAAAPASATLRSMMSRQKSTAHRSDIESAASMRADGASSRSDPAAGISTRPSEYCYDIPCEICP